ncbi:putative bifunctional diguanylate cyclase/phosphodiesterase [Clostridium sp. N3C]|uniref:putative bifunctional diguanylate cyclase/phosphodiesterase n=1 Tax=Clostridium sp. N3C TaxID=1776758 RepID=UPI0015B851C3|nr:bifunctional diguanylate cyclase/phosphodiesterase [Clostridium sp. N3C]
MSNSTYSLAPIPHEIITIILINSIALTVIGYLIRKYVAQQHSLKIVNSSLYNITLQDSLTNLPNRVYFNKCITEITKALKQNKKDQFAIAIMDLDGFKTINDSLGHNNGDIILSLIGKRLLELSNDSIIVSRFCGDEFAILVKDIKSRDEVINLIEKILISISTPFIINNHEIKCSASIGVVFSKEEYTTAEQYLKYADIAMYEAKLQGKDRYVIFDENIQKKIMKNLKLENDLKHALERNELILYYQPIVSLKTDKIIGFEALVRWNHPELGIISPTDFIPIAEETGLIIPIGKWILQEACKQVSLWQKNYKNTKSLFVNVNMSAMQLNQSDIVEQIAEVLRETKVSPNNLSIEITESSLITDVIKSQTVLEQMRNLGINIQIDDFGTGYSSLSYLQRFPFNVIKVDKSFIQQLDSNNKNHSVVKSIILMAHELNMKVTVEGIETAGQLTRLKNLGCEHGQGYYFSKPLNKDDAEKLLLKYFN